MIARAMCATALLISTAASANLFDNGLLAQYLRSYQCGDTAIAFENDGRVALLNDARFDVTWYGDGSGDIDQHTFMFKQPGVLLFDGRDCRVRVPDNNENRP